MKVFALFFVFFTPQFLFGELYLPNSLFNFNPITYRREADFEAVYYLADDDCSPSLNKDMFFRIQKANRYKVQQIHLVGAPSDDRSTRDILLEYDYAFVNGSETPNFIFKFTCHKKSASEGAADPSGSNSEGKKSAE